MAKVKRGRAKVNGGRLRRWFWTGGRRWVMLGVLALVPLGLLAAVLKVDSDIRGAMQGPTWEVPSVLYAEPIKLYPGLAWYPAQVESLLQDLGYTRQKGAPSPGTYAQEGGRFLAHLRPLELPGRKREPLRVWLRFDDAGLYEILDPAGQWLEFVETEAPKVTGFYGASRQSRDPIRLAEVPQRLKDAVLLVEDRRFYEHSGLDPRGILRALWADVRALGTVQGGSTITQQLAKNLFLTHQKTLKRKVAEAFYAMRFESLYTKDAILEAYLNEVYLGADRGVQISGMAEGARHYFGVAVRDVSLSQAALLAGLIRSPGGYDPFRKPEAAQARRRVVLDLLLAEGKIGPEERDAADRAPLGLRKAQGPLAASAASAYVDAVRTQLASLFAGPALETAGLRIYTPMDPRIQAAAQEALDSVLTKIETRRGLPEGSLEGAVVVVEPGTGAVRALVGGRVAMQGAFNRALQAKRQPGSLMKPFVYAAALASGRFTPVSLLEDTPLELTGKDGTWSPSNADGVFRGTVTLREALEQSLNVPSVRLLQQVGYGAPIEVARRAGIASPLVKDYSVVLGTSEVTPLEMAVAFATFAAGGIAADPRFVNTVISRSGEVLQEQPSAQREAVSPGVAFLINDLLRGACLRGTASSLSWLAEKFPLSGKTGTTSGGKDAWFVGYTPKFLALVWVGPDEPKDLKLSGASAALPVWNALVSKLTRYLAAPEPTPPQGVVRLEVDPQSGLLASEGCPEVVGEWFLEGTEPTETCGHSTLFEGEGGEDPWGVDAPTP